MLSYQKILKRWKYPLWNLPNQFNDSLLHKTQCLWKFICVFSILGQLLTLGEGCVKHPTIIHEENLHKVFYCWNVKYEIDRKGWYHLWGRAKQYSLKTESIKKCLRRAKAKRWKFYLNLIIWSWCMPLVSIMSKVEQTEINT